jgi:translation initiation factor IF-3
MCVCAYVVQVKVIIQFRGREQQHIDLGQELIQKLNVDLKDQANMEGDTRREGNRLTAMFKPRK